MLKLHSLNRLVRPPTPKPTILGPHVCVGLGTMDCETFDEYVTGTSYVPLDVYGSINVDLYKGVHYGYSSPHLRDPDILIERLYAYSGERLFPFHSTYYSRDGVTPATVVHPDNVQAIRSRITGSHHKERALTPLQLQRMFMWRHEELPEETHRNVMFTTFEEEAFSLIRMSDYKDPVYAKPWGVDLDIVSPNGVTASDLENRLWPYMPLVGNDYFSALAAQEYLDISIDDALTEESVLPDNVSILHAVESLAPYEVDLRYILRNGEVCFDSVAHLFNPYRTIVTPTITRSTLCDVISVSLTGICKGIFGDTSTSVVADIRVLRLLSEEVVIVVRNDSHRVVYYLDMAHMKMTAPGVVFIS